VRVDPPEPGAAAVRESWGELVAEQPEEAEHDVGVAGGVGHDLPRLDARLWVEQPIEQVQRVWLGAWDDDHVDAGVVVGGRAECRDSAATVEVAAVEAGAERAARDDEPEPVDRGDLTATPAVGERQAGVVLDDPGIRGDQRLRADVVAGDPLEPVLAQPLQRAERERAPVDPTRLRLDQPPPAAAQGRAARPCA
jgi:hypothetical protein